MSSLQGYVKTTYDKLVKTFGEPTYTDARVLMKRLMHSGC